MIESLIFLSHIRHKKRKMRAKKTIHTKGEV